MYHNGVRIKLRMRFLATLFFTMIVIVTLFLCKVCIFDSKIYSEKADELHERERKIKAARGQIISFDGTVLAGKESVCTISVVHSQLENPDEVIQILSTELGMSVEKVSGYVNKISSIERIKTNVPKETGDRIREYNLPGVKVDEDYKRVYPYSELASKVLGFTGSDNQGILGLEAKYDDYLKGKDGLILTVTDAAGIELENVSEKRMEPESGDSLVISIDYNIQKYAQQLAYQTYKLKNAKRVSIIVMNPNDGRIYAMADVPEYDLNNPYELSEYANADGESTENIMDALNQMWRNHCINDTYEPGSTFKMITATAALEEKKVSLNDYFYCGGSITVGGRKIRCANTNGHGSQSFGQTLMNSCNPAFITWGLRVGKTKFYEYLDKLGILSKTGVDLPGEAGTIIHKIENVNEVELATMSFGQSFQITPLVLLRAASAIINGGTLVTPHFAVNTLDSNGNIKEVFHYDTIEGAVSKETSETMKALLEKVVSEGGGSRCKIDGYRIGGKTATSQKLPRSERKYIASFIGFAPADDPQVIAICIIDEPSGIYYGGTIAAPVIKKLYENILPYLGIESCNLE